MHPSVNGGSTTRRGWLVVVGILLVFLIGAVALAESRLPHGDEGHFASCAWEFTHRGRLAFPMLTEFIPSLDRYMYETGPFYFVELGIVSFFTGYEISALRLNTVAWGLMLVTAWYFIMSGLTRDRLLAILTMLLVAVNYDVMNAASGRYDPVCAALYTIGLACYAWWRERNLTKAVLLGNCFVAAACITHPYGVFGVLGFSILFAIFDLRKLTVRLAAIAAVPYLVAFGAWGIYIAQNPAEFYRQITTNAKGRLTPATHPLSAIMSEIRVRYIETFAGFRGGVPVYMRVKILVLLLYVAGFIGCVFTPAIRRDKRRLALVVMGIAFACFLTFIEGQRLYIYFIHVLPVYSAVLAIWACYLLRRGRIWRVAVWAGVGLFCIYSVSAVAYRVRLNEYYSLYVPTLEFLTNTVHGTDLVMGPPQLGTRIAFREHCLDDETLGFRNGLRPSYVVIDGDFEERQAKLQTYDPAAFSHVRQILEQSQLIFERQRGPNFFRVYRVPKQA